MSRSRREARVHALMERREEYGRVLAEEGERATRVAWPRILPA